jgi:hypothetical protein
MRRTSRQPLLIVHIWTKPLSPHPVHDLGSEDPLSWLGKEITECAQCRNVIPQDHEFNCEHCGAEVCGNCLLNHEDECKSVRE